MSLLFDLEGLMSDGGLSALQFGQRDFSPYVIHFTSYRAMVPVRRSVDRMGRGDEPPSDLPGLLKTADYSSARVLTEILDAGRIEARTFHKDYVPGVCMTECTLAGALTHSARYGRYGLVFPKSVVFEQGARPLAYVPKEIRRHLIALSAGDEVIGRDLLHVTELSPPQRDGVIQDFTHEREWRCPNDIEVSDAVALIVATSADYHAFRDRSRGRPILPLDLLYRMGV